MNERVRYQELVFDSSRWDGFEYRDGDIVISTPPKCGTTWTQMLVALLVFDGPDLYAPMDGISPWLDMQTRSKEEVHALLAAQAHRRFIKTHTPLDGVPIDDRVTYLIVGRDPRDVAVSFQHHLANMDFDEFLKAREAAVGNDNLEEFAPMEPLPEEPNERIRQFIESDTFVSMTGILHHLHVGWQHRDRENVHLFHYSDYSRDLPGSLQQIASAIGAPISDRRAAELAAEASLDRMRDRAREVAPDMMHNHWKDPSAFFRSGRSGEWRENLSLETLQDYEKRSRESFSDADFWEWAHGHSPA